MNFRDLELVKRKVDETHPLTQKYREDLKKLLVETLERAEAQDLNPAVVIACIAYEQADTLHILRHQMAMLGANKEKTMQTLTEIIRSGLKAAGETLKRRMTSEENPQVH